MMNGMNVVCKNNTNRTISAICGRFKNSFGDNRLNIEIRKVRNSNVSGTECPKFD